MVKGLGNALARHPPLTLEVSEHLLLLSVYAEYGDAHGFAPATEALDFSELGVPVLDVFQREGLDKGAVPESPLLLHLVDDVPGYADTMLLLEQSDDLRCGYRQPYGIGVLRKPGLVFLRYLVKQVKVLGVLFENRRSSASRGSDASLWETVVGTVLKLFPAAVQGVATDSGSAAHQAYAVYAQRAGFGC